MRKFIISPLLFLEALQNSNSTTKWRKFPIIMSLLNGDMVTYIQSLYKITSCLIAYDDAIIGSLHLQLLHTFVNDGWQWIASCSNF